MRHTSHSTNSFSLGVKLRRSLRLPACRRALLLEALASVACLRALLWLLPFPVLGAWAAKRSGRPVPVPEVKPAQIGGAVRAAAALVPGATCLVQAPAAQRLLNRHGHPSELRLGVRRDDAGRFLAHAWVECHGQVVIGDTASAHFEPLQAAPSSRLPRG